MYLYHAIENTANHKQEESRCIVGGIPRASENVCLIINLKNKKVN